MNYLFPPVALVPIILSTFLAEHVTGQLRLCILVASCWMEASWLPTVLNMLVDITHCCPVIQNLVMFQWTRCTRSAIGTLPLQWLRDVFCVDRGSHPQSVRQWQGQLDNLWQNVPAMLEGVGQLVCWRWCSKQCLFASKLADLLVYLFMVWLAWHTIRSYHSTI